MSGVGDGSDAAPVGDVGDIVGGIPASSAWQNVVVLIESPEWSCTGTLIDSVWVLTAAHCITPRATVYGGSLSRSNLQSLGGASGTAHPLYELTDRLLRFDVGLFRLDSPHPFQGQEIPLATIDQAWAWTPGSPTIAVGWGDTAGPATPASTLQQGTMLVIDDATCADLDRQSIQVDFDPSSAFCTMSPGVSSCSGDSGGPVFATQGDTTVQVGITSYGPPSCLEHSVAMWMPSVLSWIYGQISGLGVEPVRVFGMDRYETAAVAATSWERSDVVFVATGEKFPDSLAAGTAAARLQAPVLLVRQDRVPEPTRFALERLRPSTLYVAGGPDAVSESVLVELAQITGARIERLGGKDRFETAEMFSRLAWTRPGQTPIWVASGWSFADPLVAAGAAAVYGEPFVLVDGNRPLSSASRALIAGMNPSFISVVAAPGTMSSAMLADLGEIAELEVFDHPDTSTRSAEVWYFTDGFGGSSPWAAIATLDDFADALAAVAWTGLRPVSPLMLVDRNCVSPGVLDVIQELDVELLAIFGGPSALGAGIDTLTRC